MWGTTSPRVRKIALPFMSIKKDKRGSVDWCYIARRADPSIALKRKTHLQVGMINSASMPHELVQPTLVFITALMGCFNRAQGADIAFSMNGSDDGETGFLAGFTTGFITAVVILLSLVYGFLMSQQSAGQGLLAPLHAVVHVLKKKYGDADMQQSAPTHTSEMASTDSVSAGEYRWKNNRTVATQSQVRYSWQSVTPRFVLLPEASHGASLG